MIRTIFILFAVAISSLASASENIQFTNKELSAVFTLMRPELNSIELNGRRAIFQPAPSMKYLGLEASDTILDLSVFGNIVGLEFNHLKAKTPEVKFQNGSFEVSVPVEDQVRGVQSHLGSISFKNVVIRAQLGWHTRTDGRQELVLTKTIFEGSLKGTGVLSSNFILSKTRDLCMSLMGKSLKKALAGEKIQNGVNVGLVEYAKFYSGIDAKDITPTSIQFFNDGIKYDVN